MNLGLSVTALILGLSVTVNLATRHLSITARADLYKAACSRSTFCRLRDAYGYLCRLAWRDIKFANSFQASSPKFTSQAAQLSFHTLARAKGQSLHADWCHVIISCFLLMSAGYVARVVVNLQEKADRGQRSHGNRSSKPCHV